ncbi:MAG: hypothetical protein INF92_14435 [Rhodobacter sp.]|nr:hypothetical protein [Rhodobacter sp.]
MILGLTTDQYVIAIECGELRSTVVDQSEEHSWRSFHSFWDLVECMASRYSVMSTQHRSSFRQAVSEASDDLHLAIFGDDEFPEPNSVHVMPADRFAFSRSSFDETDVAMIQARSTSVDTDAQCVMQVVLYCVERVLVRISDLIYHQPASHCLREAHADQLCLPFGTQPG